MENSQQSGFPAEVVQWVKDNPEYVERWMTDPSFRHQLLENPGQFGLTGPAGEWVNERVQHHSVDRLVGAADEYFVAM